MAERLAMADSIGAIARFSIATQQGAKQG